MKISGPLYNYAADIPRKDYHMESIDGRKFWTRPLVI